MRKANTLTVTSNHHPGPTCCSLCQQASFGQLSKMQTLLAMHGSFPDPMSSKRFRMSQFVRVRVPLVPPNTSTLCWCGGDLQLSGSNQTICGICRHCTPKTSENSITLRASSRAETLAFKGHSGARSQTKRGEDLAGPVARYTNRSASAARIWTNCLSENMKDAELRVDLAARSGRELWTGPWENNSGFGKLKWPRQWLDSIVAVPKPRQWII